ncbi:molybdate transport system substrate-binding protein [Luteibacter sp. UNCMF331Sha3.1]|uniref:molybdate ABC transporter substrate-binding protein n=1 Tax=Luteibacter sp. UNCMF331Sha3.1 TaxID=1502760 RepID=UPI0008C98B22|nr:molybdate ABC transporter substrate-binding protein [Luteibacter sp. UNCMF331Sha3.1]SEM51142.1 molybdate transport system substrate-binding protein [Luteibacter sp. UNCMF331Sha3.1]
MRLRLPAALFLLVASGSAGAADLVVSAAASLTDAFRAVGAAYEAKHPETHVVLNFAASDVLLRQIASGAPADVFASADQTAMDKAAAAKAIDPATRQDFALNRLVLIVPRGNPAKVSGIGDLAGPGVKRVAYGDPASVPAGRYTRAALEQQNLWPAVAAKGVLAQNVRQALDYVARGEVEAGFVFATDATVAHDRVVVAAVVPTPTPIRYPIAVVASSKQPKDAAAFEAFVQSPEGRRILAGFGFQAP